MIHKNGIIFLVGWSILIVMIFFSLGSYTISIISKYKDDAVARHNARIDPKATELGKTAADDALPEGAQPRQVLVGMYLDGISSISLAESYWNPVFYIWFRWKGDDINPGETFKMIDGRIQSKEKMKETMNGDEHYALYRVEAELTKFFTTDRFPLDDHLLTIAIEDNVMQWKDLEYVADAESTKVSSRVKMPGYVVSKSGIVVKPHAYKSNLGDPLLAVDTKQTYSQCMFGIWNKRPGLGTYFKIFVGLFAAVLIALLPFFIRSTYIDARFALGVGGFFGAVANTFVAASMVNDSGILTLMDFINGIGMITIFLAVIQSTISFHLAEIKKEEALASMFDKVSVVVFAASFIIINVSIPMAGLVQ